MDEFKVQINKVSVNGSSIQVRRGLLTKFSLDVTDIDQVDWITSFTKLGKNENVTVRAGLRKFKVETLMENSEKMTEFLRDNIHESKIRMITKDFTN